jgi:mannitol/fructose-specific phosphotransferase system IIA component (Ntr-type)
MRLSDFFSHDAIQLEMRPEPKPDLLAGMVGLLHLDAPTSTTLTTLLERREAMGSTGVGRGIAIPHCRAPAVPQLRLAFGRVPAGVAYGSIDNLPVRYLFLIVAPPLEVSNLYLPVLGRLAQFAKEADIPDRLAALAKPDDFFRLLDERSA